MEYTKLLELPRRLFPKHIQIEEINQKLLVLREAMDLYSDFHSGVENTVTPTNVLRGFHLVLSEQCEELRKLQGELLALYQGKFEVEEATEQIETENEVPALAQ